MSADEIPDVKYPEKVEIQPDRIPPRAEWAMSCVAIRSNSIRIRQEDMRRHAIRSNSIRTIAYPIWICCPDGKHWLKWASLATLFRKPATAHVPPPSNGVSGLPVRTSLPWIPKNSPQSRIALVIKKLSKHQNLTQFWLELITRVLNMLIGLKGDNYYSKVFKRVNYKLWNNTFWVVISSFPLKKFGNLGLLWRLVFSPLHVKGEDINFGLAQTVDLLLYV